MLDRKDKKFIAALVFAQTGLLMTAISVSAYFWHHSMVRLQGMGHLYKFSKSLKSINFEKQRQKKNCVPKEQEPKKIIM